MGWAGWVLSVRQIDRNENSGWLEGTLGLAAALVLAAGNRKTTHAAFSSRLSVKLASVGWSLLRLSTSL